MDFISIGVFFAAFWKFRLFEVRGSGRSKLSPLNIYLSVAEVQIEQLDGNVLFHGVINWIKVCFLRVRNFVLFPFFFHKG